jgi:hypothetical protein
MQKDKEAKLAEFLDPKRLNLPAGFQKIFIKELIPKSIEDKLVIINTYYKSRFSTQSSKKPISKIIDE